MSELTKQFIDQNIPKLGFGIMRLPTHEDKNIDMPRFIEMVDYYMNNGMNYFDTAYMYHGGQSEGAVKAAVVDRFPRESFKIATKLPMWSCETPADMGRIFNEQLQRLGVDYVDFYMLHAMNDDNHNKAVEFGAYDYLKELKAQGKVKYIGFSFHGTAEVLDRMLREHPEMEFVQLQINYLDWTEEAKEFYDITLKYGKQIIIMEPVRGGALAQLPRNLEPILKTANPNASIAWWALRWCVALDNIMITLSGMSNMEQLTENVEIFKNPAPLTAAESALIERVITELGKYPQVNCTECKYCECPIEIPISEIFKRYNRFVFRKGIQVFKKEYIKFEKRGDSCAECGKCEAVCPQSVKIIEQLKYIDDVYSKL